jgi:hypothetical protein
MWIHRLYVWFDGKRKLWQEGTRDQVMAVMCSAAEAARLVALGASGWQMTQEFHSQVV